MASHPLTDPEVLQLEQQLLAAVPAQGPIGNGALREKLGWDEERYWYTRNRLLQSGALITGRGPGGSVQRVVSVAASASSPVQAAQTRIAEAKLYDPIVATLSSQWVPDHQIQDHVIHLTGKADATPAASGLELNTFEVKPHDALDVTAVYKALAHRRAAHYSFVLAHVPDSQRENLASVLQRLKTPTNTGSVSW